GLVDEHAVRRSREDAAAEPLVHENVRDERDRLALHREAIRVELLRDESAFADVEEVPRRINDVRGDADDELRVFRIERPDANLGVATASGPAAVPDEVEKVPAVRKEVRISMRRVHRSVDRRFRDFSAFGGHPVDRSARARREENDSLPVPGPTPAFRTGRQREDRTAVDVDLLEEAVREEPDVPSIRGPERSLRTLRSGERMRARLRELSHPEKIGVFPLPR